MLHKVTLIAVAFAVFSCGSSNCSAQIGGTTSSGAFGSRTLGSGISSSSGAFGRGGTGTGAAGGRTTQNQGNVGGLDNVGRTGQSAFVGADAGDATTNARSQLQNGLGGRGGLQSLLGAFGQGNRNNQGARGNNAAPRIQVSMRLRTGFRVPRPLSSVVQSGIQARFADPRIAERLGIQQVIFNEGTVILRGTVTDPDDLVLAEKMAMLEPGVSAVQNELTVVPPQLQSVPAGSP